MYRCLLHAARSSYATLVVTIISIVLKIHRQIHCQTHRQTHHYTHRYTHRYTHCYTHRRNLCLRRSRHYPNADTGSLPLRRILRACGNHHRFPPHRPYYIPSHRTHPLGRNKTSRHNCNLDSNSPLVHTRFSAVHTPSQRRHRCYHPALRQPPDLSRHC
ncbi:hypothetical protein GGS24DRAFT_457205 [Hypoxylon argillaceum]|nr:hypothetical protein GGS24DRAFT_457205 [Hypoxylon argillaceum]